MHDDLLHRPRTFPGLPLGKNETVPDLRRLLYKGGAGARPAQADQAIREGLLGQVLPERIELVHLIHENLSGKFAGGGRAQTLRGEVRRIRDFFKWADASGATLSTSTVLGSYLEWSEHLLRRVKAKELKMRSAYGLVMAVGGVLDGVLGRATPMVELTRIRRPKGRKTPQGAKADKQNLQETFAFGHLLADICDGLPLGVIWGPLVARIPLQGGGEISLWGGGRPLSKPNSERVPSKVHASAKKMLAYENDRTMNHRMRRARVNLRIEAELCMFIGQTGMNLANAQQLQLCHFSYSSDIDGYKVRDHKNRRGGEVLFEIYSEYRGHFERYLAWRRELFSESELLFPFLRRGARECKQLDFRNVKNACKQAGVRWVPASVLRGTRVNWLLRRSRDPDLTAEMAQHHKQTLLDVYERPSQQVAVVELIRFWSAHDPTLARKKPSLAVAPGSCNGTPVASSAKPESAPKPDCRTPSGCLWCEHHRDIDSQDYVWSVASFRHLKTLELSRYCPPVKERGATHPADHAIQRLSEKLAWFRDSNAQRRGWVDEALARIEESAYSDQWSHLIEAMEGQSE
ncbi:site-specific integrase [Caldimonas tepidiphila]|uniref:site-specific integrase n=1 Tax=Caldimonas tepidiphila TaxID=2315841 RepID=UPI0013008212|nr:site-specific integrase [Caldimonas tepidiphila]